MCQPPQFTVDFENHTILGLVRYTANVPHAIQCWTAHVARDVLRLGVYLYASTIWYRIPGAENYRWQPYDDAADDAPPGDDDPREWLEDADNPTILNVLAECLRRLKAERVMKDVPGGASFQPTRLDDEWIEYLDRLEKFKGGLLSVAAECLDQLIVHPGLAEINNVPEPTWWQKWWARMDN